ncbi:MAG: CHC2 zinc finger domain-containing protein, partial [Planctomycetaceae bacterium]
MSSGFPIEFKEQVRSRTNLVDLIGESVALSPRRGGTDYVGLCPFHDDHNPSFHVYPDRQSYRCWVCQAGGDCFSWVMHQDAVEFPQAVEILARRARLELPERSRRGRQAASDQRDRLYDVLSWAEQEFQAGFFKSSAGEPARRYMADRGFTDETLREFHIGCQPGGWQWLLDRARPKFSADDLKAARLANDRREGDGCYDFFRGRVMFPIRDGRGRTVAFGGRVLPGLD